MTLWREWEFLRWLGKLNGADTGAHHISANGEFVVGGTNSNRDFFWSDTTSMLDLGNGPSDDFPATETIAVSNDGLVVGYGDDGPFIWDIENGRRPLTEELERHGIDLGGWQLNNVVDISADGRTLLGTALNPDAHEAWIATFPGLPDVSAADYNDDGTVDAADYTIWRDSLGQNVTLGTGADGDEDGYIGLEDYDL